DALRDAGFRERIVVLGLWPPQQAEEVVRADLESVVSAGEAVEALAGAARATDKRAAVHVKVDTGMCRVGVEPERALSLCRSVSEHSELKLAGVMTHFACAESDADATQAQWAQFQDVIRAVRAAGGPPPAFHVANSAAAL